MLSLFDQDAHRIPISNNTFTDSVLQFTVSFINPFLNWVWDLFGKDLAISILIKRKNSLPRAMILSHLQSTPRTLISEPFPLFKTAFKFSWLGLPSAAFPRWFYLWEEPEVTGSKIWNGSWLNTFYTDLVYTQ